MRRLTIGQEDLHRHVTTGGVRVMKAVTGLVLAGALACGAVEAQNRSEDEYTRYELLALETASFKIVYDVTAVTPGARFFFNPIRRGSVARDESVVDLMTGAPLRFEEISGADARQSGLPNADLEGRYIRVELARAVPPGGEGRIRIIKTYKDPKSYFRDGDVIVFDRPLGIKRNSVVLPPGYELLACNVPSQVPEEADGRISISFMNPSPGSAPLVLRARPHGVQPVAILPRPASEARVRVAAAPEAVEPPVEQVRVSERAFQDREIVYFLHEPRTHSFSLYHDYTETREGIGRYVNVVRQGSRVSKPSARILDTGEMLETRILEGAGIADAGIDIGEPVRPDSGIVLVEFPPLRKGQSLRLRIEETYTDPSRYDQIEGQLMWRRSLGRPRSDLVLPPGWYLTTSSIPAVVTETDDGRIRLAFVNPRPDSIVVFVKARRRK